MKKPLFFTVLFAAFFVNAQISVNENFDANTNFPTGFEGTTTGNDPNMDAATIMPFGCTTNGVYLGTGQESYTSYLKYTPTQNSAGQPISLEFGYKHYYSDFKVEYAVGSGSYQLLDEVIKGKTMEMTNCLTYTKTIPSGTIPSGSSFNIRISVKAAAGAGGQGSMITIDNFKLSQTTLGVSDINKTKNKIFYNAQNNSLKIINGDKLKNYKIFDMNGRTVQSGKCNSDIISLNFKDKGLFIFQADDTITMKFMK